MQIQHNVGHSVVSVSKAALDLSHQGCKVIPRIGNKSISNITQSTLLKDSITQYMASVEETIPGTPTRNPNPRPKRGTQRTVGGSRI